MPAPDFAIHLQTLLQALFSIELAWLTFLWTVRVRSRLKPTKTRNALGVAWAPFATTWCAMVERITTNFSSRAWLERRHTSESRNAPPVCWSGGSALAFELHQERGERVAEAF